MLIIILKSIMLQFFLLAQSSKVETLKLHSDQVSTVYISNRGAVLNFPTKPSNVVAGNQGNFAIEYINNDLVISPLIPTARANIFIYLGNRRFNLDLVSKKGGYTLIQIRDSQIQSKDIKYVR